MDFLHGVETIELSAGSVPVTVVKSAVIGLVGIAPKGPSQVLTLVSNKTDAAQFGSPLTGFTIPQALSAIFAQGNATILVANVYDEASHSVSISGENQEVENSRLSLAYNPVNDAVLKVPAVSEILATANIAVTGGTVGGGNQITQITVGAVDILSGPVAFDTDNATSSVNVVSDINLGTGTHGFSAVDTGSGNFTLSAPVGTGASINGTTITITVGGDVTCVVSGSGEMSTGVTGSAAITLTSGVDYTIDDYGNVIILNPLKAPEATILDIDYKRLDPALVVSSDIIGDIDATTQARTGVALFDLSFTLFGMNAKLFIAPKYSTTIAVSSELIALASDFKGMAIVDAPEGTSPVVAFNGRGPLGTINFQTSSERAILLYPHLKDYDAATDSDVVVPFSPYYAGVVSNNDYNNGYWSSPSNIEIKSITGVERTISFAVNNDGTEANLLNSAGIVTVANSFGTGNRVWGNRTAAYPTYTDPKKVFISVRRTADVLHESLELAMLQFIDKPINKGVIDSVRATVLSFMRTLFERGAILGGFSCVFDPAKNTPANLAAGQLIFDITFMPPTPAERITFESFIDISLLATLTA